MATGGNLGEYKIVISADYKELQSQIKAATDIIQQSANNIAKQFDELATKINASVSSINTNIGEMSQTFAKVGAESLSKEIESLGNSTEKAAPKAKKTADGYKSLESQMRKARLEAQKGWVIGGDDKLFAQQKENFTDLTTRLKTFNTDLKENLTQREQQEKEHYERIEQRAKQNAQSNKQYWIDMENESKRRTAQIKSDFESVSEQLEQKTKQTAQNNKQYWIDMENERKRRTAQIKADFEAVAPAIQPLRTQLAEAKKAAENAFGTSGFETAKANYQDLLAKSNAINRELNGINSMGVNGLEKSIRKSTTSMTNLERLTNKMRAHVEWMISATLSGALVIAPIAAVHSIADLEQEMAGMIQTLPQLHHNQQAVNQTATQFIGIAEQYGVGVDKIVEAGKLWSRGYKDVDDVMKLTELSAKLAVADLMDVGLANRAVESTINSFGRQGDAVNFAMHVTDAWTNVAHNAQSSATDLATAMMRSGAAAHAVGVSFDMATALASTMIKTTGLEGENVGNALKSIYSSLQSDKAIKDLTRLGIAVYEFEENGTRHFRNVEKVMVDLMLASHETQENMAKTLQNISGGKFQWSKVAALFSDYKDFINAYTLSVTSTNFAEGQVEAQIDTINRRMEQLKQAMVGVLSSVGNAGLTNFIKDILTGLKGLVDFLQRVPSSVYSLLETFGRWYVEGRLIITVLNGTVKAGNLLAAMLAKNTASETANTLSMTANTIAHSANAGATEKAAISSGIDTVAKEVETVATTEATGATISFSTALAFATAGLSVVLGAIALVTAGYGAYTASVGNATEAQQKESEQTQKNIDIKKEELQNNEEQTKLFDTLSEAYINLNEKLNQTAQNTEEYKKIQEDEQATEKALTKLIGEDAMERIKSSGDIRGAISEEKKAYIDKAEAIKAEISELRQKQIDQAQVAVNSAEAQIKAIQAESDSFFSLNGVINTVIRAYGSLLVAKGRVQQALATKITGGRDEQAYNAATAIIEQGEKYENYDRKSDKLSVAESSLTDAQLALKKLQLAQTNEYVKNISSTGGTQVPEDANGGTGSGGSGRTVDNSNEAQAWRFFKGKSLSNEMSAGIIGNLEVESPGLVADSWDSTGESYGIGQWTRSSGRYQKLLDYAQTVKGDATTLATQLNFLWYELTEGDYAHALPKIAQESTNPENAAYAVAKYYEAPAWKENPERQKNARNIFDSMSSSNGEINVADYEKQQKSIEEIQKRQYDTLKKQYDVLVAQTELEMRRKNQYMTANDRLYLWNQVMGVNGGNVDFNSSVSTGNIGAAIVEEAKSHYEGEQWKAADNDDLARQCASFVTDVWRKVGITSVGSSNGNTMVSQAGSAYHTANSGYTPNVGDMINWAEHVGIYMGNGQYTARNSTGGVHTGSMAEAQQWFGSPEGYISVRELPDAKNISTKIFSSFSQFQKDNAQMIGNALKEKAELWKDKYAYNEAVTSAGGIDALTRLESTIQQSVNANKPLGKTEEKIYEEMLKVKGGQALQGSPDWYKAQTAIAKLYADNMRKQVDFEEKASQKHINALSAMTEKEMEWANKHNLVSDRDMLNYQINKNETNYAQHSGLMETELSKTAKAGQEQAIVEAYHNMMQAVTEEETKAAATHLMTLSADTDATIKAIDKMQDAYEKYYQTREKLAEKYEDSIRRYWFAGVSGLQSGLESAMDGILNKTKSFAQAFRDIFSSVWKALVSQFSKDFASRIMQGLNPIKLNNNQGNTVPASGSYNAVAGVGTNWLMGALLGSGTKGSTQGTASLYKPITQFSSQIFNTMNMTKNAITSSMQAISSTSLNTIDGIKNSFLQAEVEKRTASKITGNTVTQDSETTKTSVLANISTMVTQMLAAMAIMWALSAIFGGGSSTETSTSSVNLGRSPTSYYSTPSTISQVQVPSFDTGALQIPQDMLAMVHQNEMVIPASLADNIRSMGNQPTTNTGGKVVVNNSVIANAIDGRGIKEMLHTNNRTLAKSVKEAYRRFDTNV